MRILLTGSEGSIGTVVARRSAAFSQPAGVLA